MKITGMSYSYKLMSFEVDEQLEEVDELFEKVDNQFQHTFLSKSLPL